MLNIKCSKDASHKKFHVSAHVVQDWETNETGDYVSTVNECSEVTHFPKSDDVWTCAECGAAAIAESVDD